MIRECKASRAGCSVLPPSFNLQRKCACGTHAAGRQCLGCARKERTLRHQARNDHDAAEVPPIVYDVLRSPGQPLDAETRAFFEPRFACDFSGVRVHTDAKAAESTRAVDAFSYAVGHDLVFGIGQYAPAAASGRRLLAHELTHIVQQRTAAFGATLIDAEQSNSAAAEAEADPVSADVLTGRDVGAIAAQRSAPALQRKTDRPPVSLRAPAFEELATQVSDVSATFAGRPLSGDEAGVARRIFANSIEYSRVRLLPTDLLEYRTVGNTIRVPRNFSIASPDMAETFIHELVHVWQYQHGGTSYISISLVSQIEASIIFGSLNRAYDYQISPRTSFFDFRPEQQGLIIQNYFAMVRDSTAPRDARTYRSNHMDASGRFYGLSWDARQAEIRRELLLHEPLLTQMRTAVPEPHARILMMRASEVMRVGGEERAPIPRESQLTPVKPLLEIAFP